MNYFIKCKTLDEAKTQFKKQALKLHPDKGGETADFQETYTRKFSNLTR